MIAVPNQQRAQHKTMETSRSFTNQALDFSDFEKVLDEVQSTMSPLWPLQDFVAVNPFVGMTQQSFLDARLALRKVRDCELLMPVSYFKQAFERGEILHEDISNALVQCQNEYPALYSNRTTEQFLQLIQFGEADRLIQSKDRSFWTVAESVDKLRGTTWSSTIINEISRHCAAHYDQGQAIWESPWKQLSLYDAWRETAKIDLRLERLGIKGFRRFVFELPNTPRDAIHYLLKILKVPQKCWKDFLLCQLYSIAGWSSFVKYRVREASMSGKQDDDLVGLLAIRLAYDVALIESNQAPKDVSMWPHDFQPMEFSIESHALMNSDARSRYLLQVAAEIAFQRKLCASLLNRKLNQEQSTLRIKVQMVFCIDVRSEIIRRHLEASSNGIQTFGFAGFFGLPIEYIPLGATSGTSQCPVLLKPSVLIQEKLKTDNPKVEQEAVKRRHLVRRFRNAWKFFQSSATSCFSFVESFGLFCAAKLVMNAIGFSKPVSPSRFDGVYRCDQMNLGPSLKHCGEYGLSAEKQADFAEGILRNLGLTNNFARIVAICGHASDTSNNPYRAGLDCGACGGHSGESNARVAVLLLNDQSVRSHLTLRGIEIPIDTWFVAGLHNTTTDDIRFFDLQSMPASHAIDYQDLTKHCEVAGIWTRTERTSRMAEAAASDLKFRSREWSEVRPEWGLAGNAAFVVAPRARTQGLQLDGRVFMHSYDFHRDPELKILELIMTAPMVVTNWINLQYYASTVDNANFGSGNKTIHNVVGQFGILQGNAGDLMTGLPWQSVHDGKRYQHEPLRLLVVIEAPRDSIDRILQKHSNIKELVDNGWLSLFAIEEERCFQRSKNNAWQAKKFSVEA